MNEKAVTLPYQHDGVAATSSGSGVVVAVLGKRVEVRGPWDVSVCSELNDGFQHKDVAGICSGKINEDYQPPILQPTQPTSRDQMIANSWAKQSAKHP